ncbi:MAG: hypothetical protein QOG69_1901, partial [Actinomycetota bacterium]|nr:hypothetical protein [Actinomycetota bacterium]
LKEESSAKPTMIGHGPPMARVAITTNRRVKVLLPSESQPVGSEPIAEDPENLAPVPGLHRAVEHEPGLAGAPHTAPPNSVNDGSVQPPLGL